MKLASSTALITGANRGLGRQFAEQFSARSAEVYATARNPEHINTPGVETLQLGITGTASVVAAAAVAPDVDVLISNAGTATNQNLVTGDLEKIRLELNSHYFGTLNMVRAFAPVLATNGGGAILNVLPILSRFSCAGANAYCAAKAAERSLTDGIRDKPRASRSGNVGHGVAPGRSQYRHDCRVGRRKEPPSRYCKRCAQRARGQ